MFFISITTPKFAAAHSVNYCGAATCPGSGFSQKRTAYSKKRCAQTTARRQTDGLLPNQFTYRTFNTVRAWLSHIERLR
jgi:hypothetical protein